MSEPTMTRAEFMTEYVQLQKDGISHAFVVAELAEHAGVTWKPEIPPEPEGDVLVMDEDCQAFRREGDGFWYPTDSTNRPFYWADLPHPVVVYRAEDTSPAEPSPAEPGLCPSRRTWPDGRTDHCARPRGHEGLHVDGSKKSAWRQSDDPEPAKHEAVVSAVALGGYRVTCKGCDWARLASSARWADDLAEAHERNAS